MSASASGISMTAADEAADIAFERFAAEQSRLAAMMGDPAVDRDALRGQLQRTALAEHAFKDRFLEAPLSEVTPHQREHGRLACEGVALVSALAAFVGLFLPDLVADFWPLAVTFAAVAGLGAWTIHFLGRLSHHLGRRM